MVNSSAIWITSEFFKEYQNSTRTSTTRPRAILMFFEKLTVERDLSSLKTHDSQAFVLSKFHSIYPNFSLFYPSYYVF
jgi:hypothetical protein